jgi:hypothetical protein
MDSAPSSSTDPTSESSFSDDGEFEGSMIRRALDDNHVRIGNLANETPDGVTRLIDQHFRRKRSDPRLSKEQIDDVFDRQSQLWDESGTSA